MGDITNNFSYHEFACKCGVQSCPLRDGKAINKNLVYGLELIRDGLGKPIIPTSGCRCVYHNRSVGGVKHSLHLASSGCRAVDFLVTDAIERYIITSIAIEIGFSVGISKDFMHLDNRGGDSKIFLY